MRIIAYIILTIGYSLMWSWYVNVFAKSAVHEILAGIYALMFVICIAGLGLLAAVDRAANRLPKPRTRAAPIPPPAGSSPAPDEPIAVRRSPLSPPDSGPAPAGAIAVRRSKF